MTRTPDVERVARSRDKLRAAGGAVTSIRLSPEAEAAVQRIIAAGHATTRRGAIEWALMEGAARPLGIYAHRGHGVMAQISPEELADAVFGQGGGQEDFRVDIVTAGRVIARLCRQPR